MAEFNADRLRERLERLNREQLARIEQLAEELLNEARHNKPAPKRSGPRRVAPDTGSEVA